MSKGKENNVIVKIKQLYTLNEDPKAVVAQLSKLAKMGFNLDCRTIIGDAGMAFNEGKETFSMKGLVFPKDGYTDALNLQCIAGACVPVGYAHAIVPPCTVASKLGEIPFGLIWDLQTRWRAALNKPTLDKTPAIWGHCYATPTADFFNADGDEFVKVDFMDKDGAPRLHYVHVVMSGIERKSFEKVNTVGEGWVFTECVKSQCITPASVARKHTHAIHSNTLTHLRLGELDLQITPPICAYRGNMEKPVSGEQVDLNSTHSFATKTNKKDAHHVAATVRAPAAAPQAGDAAPGGTPTLGANGDDDVVEDGVHRYTYPSAREALVGITASLDFEHCRAVLQNGGNGWRAALNNSDLSASAKKNRRTQMSIRFINRIYSGEGRKFKDILDDIHCLVQKMSPVEAEYHVAYCLVQLTLGGSARLAEIDGQVVKFQTQ